MKHFAFADIGNHISKEFIGFNNVLQLLNTPMEYQNTSYPPYNIIEISDNEYQIDIAVAGFTDDMIDITVNDRKLIIAGQCNNDDDTTYLHKGISNKEFVREFILNEFVEIENAELKSGLLVIKLVKHVPEKLKPKSIKIKTA